MTTRRPLLPGGMPALCAALCATLCAATFTPARAEGRCEASAQGAAPRVVELYTSEGCNSCPPADRWLSTLKGQPGVLAAAFHVDYWDRLGWADRFASAAATQRQAATQATSGVNFSYTPQVLVDGRDWRQWPRLPAAAAAPSGVGLALSRQGEVVTVALSAPPGQRVSLWWALLEDGHHSAVQAGENAGATLAHDHVVRRHGVLPVSAGPWQIAAPPRGEGGRPARLLVVAVDAASGRTLQAAELGC